MNYRLTPHTVAVFLGMCMFWVCYLSMWIVGDDMRFLFWSSGAVRTMLLYCAACSTVIGWFILGMFASQHNRPAQILFGLLSLVGVVVLIYYTNAGRGTRTAEHANIVLNEEGCKTLSVGDHAVATKAGNEPGTCRLEDITVSSRGLFGEKEFFAISEIPGQGEVQISIRQEYVLWVEFGNISWTRKAFAN